MSSVRDDIARILESVNIGCSEGGDYRLCNPYCENPNQVADRILSLKYPNGQPKLGIISEDQSLPNTDTHVLGFLSERANSTQRDMLKANFKRIEVKE